MKRYLITIEVEVLEESKLMSYARDLAQSWGRSVEEDSVQDALAEALVNDGPVPPIDYGVAIIDIKTKLKPQGGGTGE